MSFQRLSWRVLCRSDRFSFQRDVSVVGCWRLNPRQPSVPALVLGETQRSRSLPFSLSLLNLLHYPATRLSSPSDLLLSFLSPLPFPFCLPHFPPLLLSGLINNEWSRSSIDPILFVLAQQKISNLSDDLKIALHCGGGDGSGRVCWVKGRNLFFLWWEVSS